MRFLGSKLPQFYFCEEVIQIYFIIKQLSKYALKAKILFRKNFFSGRYQLSRSFAPNRSSLQENADK